MIYFYFCNKRSTFICRIFLLLLQEVGSVPVEYENTEQTDIHQTGCGLPDKHWLCKHRAAVHSSRPHTSSGDYKQQQASLVLSMKWEGINKAEQCNSRHIKYANINDTEYQKLCQSCYPCLSHKVRLNGSIYMHITIDSHCRKNIYKTTVDVF